MRFLVLQHAPHEGPGRYAELAKKMGIQLETVELWKPGYMLPAPAAYGKYAAAIIMGGPQGVNDSKNDYPSKDEEINFILRFDKPILGHCLGSQLIANAFGGRVYKDRKECGFYPVRKAQRGIFDGFQDRFQVFHWHGDSFEVPDNAVPLAYSLSGGSIQAFGCGNKFGLLFHLEMTRQMIADLLGIDKEWFERGDHGNTEQTILQKAEELDRQMEWQAEKLFSNFVSAAQNP